MSSITKREVVEPCNTGWAVLSRKLRTMCFILMAPAAVVIVRLLSPFVIIRFSGLRSSRIGHFAAETELYLCQKDAQLQNPKTLDIFYTVTPICNMQLLKMWRRKLHIYDFARWVDRFNRRLPGAGKHIVHLPDNLDFPQLIEDAPAHLSFTCKEEGSGKALLDKLGIGNNPFICFYARDCAYLSSHLPSEDWRYHDYRDCSIRNYLPAMDEVARRGYFAVRMGAVVKEPLNAANPKIIDYASNGRSDFLDMYLSAKCSFFVSTSAGLNAIPRIFRRPMVHTNYVPFELKHLFICLPGSLLIPKKLWLSAESRFLTLSEIISGGIDKFYDTRQYKQLGIDVIENTPEEILTVTIEMEERLKGVWRETEKDKELQKHFWSAIDPTHARRKTHVFIGAEFLRQNQEFLR